MGNKKDAMGSNRETMGNKRDAMGNNREAMGNNNKEAMGNNGKNKVCGAWWALECVIQTLMHTDRSSLKIHNPRML